VRLARLFEPATVPAGAHRAVGSQKPGTKRSTGRPLRLGQPSADKPRVLGQTGTCAPVPEGCKASGRGACQTFNDPSAGSPTETLLRLLLPLSATVWSSFRQLGSVNRQANNPRTSLKHSIGSSDGRCVQRAGT
jgi:hypothetical protein